MSAPTVDKANRDQTGQFGVPNVPPDGAQGPGATSGRVARSIVVPASSGFAPEIDYGEKTGGKLYYNTSRVVEIPMSYTAQNPALAYGFAYFPQVPPQKIWEVLKVSASQNDPWAAALANALLVYRFPQQLQDTAGEPPSFGAFMGSLGTLAAAPGIITFPGGKVIYVQGMERVAIVGKALANGLQLQCSMEVIEHERETFLRMLHTQ